MKRLFVVAGAVCLGLALLEELLSPGFGECVRQLLGATFAVISFGSPIRFAPNTEPASRGNWDSNAIIQGEGEVFGFQFDSGLAYQAVTVFLALWAGSRLQGRRFATLLRGLVLVYVFVVVRIGLMHLEVLSNHECRTPDAHWTVTRLGWFGATLSFINWEIAMDLVVSILFPFVIWAIVCGRDIFAPLGWSSLFPERAPVVFKPEITWSPGFSTSVGGFNPFPTGDIAISAEEAVEEDVPPDEPGPIEDEPHRAVSDQA